MKNSNLEIIPLGGLGEIGLNSLVIKYGSELILIDAGLMFPNDLTPGIDYIIPNFTYLIENKEKLKAIFLTHGHEDHIGALAYLLQEVNAPIYGTKFTLALVENKLKEIENIKYELIEVSSKEIVKCGNFEIDFINVSHSIVDGVALAIKTPVGNILHTGDFKIDSQGANSTDLAKFEKYGSVGLLALLSDSTNADVLGHSQSEVLVGETLSKIFSEKKGRLIIACFASSVVRLNEIIKAAQKSKRKICFDGRSMRNIVSLAKNLNYITIDDEDIIETNDLDKYKDENILIVATGSQGEPMSALARMAYGEHKKIPIKKGDTIIFSARAIPGNEKAINSLVDNFYRLGAEIIDSQKHNVHSSGHGHSEELKLILNLTKAQYIIPIHGEMRHLIAHKNLALELGWPKKNIFILNNGDCLSFSENEVFFGEPVFTGKNIVDGNSIAQVEDPVLRNRLRLADFGIIIITIVINQENKLAGGPQLERLGVQYENDFDLRPEVESFIKIEVTKWLKENNLFKDEENLENLKEKLRRDVRRFYRKAFNRKPYILAQIILT